MASRTFVLAVVPFVVMACASRPYRHLQARTSISTMENDKERLMAGLCADRAYAKSASGNRYRGTSVALFTASAIGIAVGATAGFADLAADSEASSDRLGIMTKSGILTGLIALTGGFVTYLAANSNYEEGLNAAVEVPTILYGDDPQAAFRRCLGFDDEDEEAKDEGADAEKANTQRVESEQAKDEVEEAKDENRKAEDPKARSEKAGAEDAKAKPEDAKVEKAAPKGNGP